MPEVARGRKFLFEPARFKNDPAVMGMTCEGRGVYAILFCEGWDMPEPGVFPDDDDALSVLARCDFETWDRVRAEVARAFDTTSRPGWWIQKGLVATHDDQANYLDGKRKAGQVGGIKSGEKRRKRSTTRSTASSTHRSTREANGLDGMGRVGVVETEESTPLAPSPRANGDAVPARRSPPPRVVAEGFAALPTNTNGDWSPSVDEIAAWEAAYPAVALAHTFHEMRAWLIANPTRRKTENGMARFVNTWLAKEQNSP